RCLREILSLIIREGNQYPKMARPSIQMRVRLGKKNLAIRGRPRKRSILTVKKSSALRFPGVPALERSPLIFSRSLFIRGSFILVSKSPRCLMRLVRKRVSGFLEPLLLFLLNLLGEMISSAAGQKWKMSRKTKVKTKMRLKIKARDGI
ncbi:hypothetical protein KJ582_01460, partial [bacterium]|nr:hypothetical protein [bacterium]